MGFFDSSFYYVRDSFMRRNHLRLSSVWDFTCLLLILYFGYSKCFSRILEGTKIPKLYQKTIRYSLWMGSLHLMTTILCFIQISTFLHPSVLEISPPPLFVKEVLNALSANICQYNTLLLGKSVPKESSVPLEDSSEWTLLNSMSIYVVCAVLLQEIFLATRNNMDAIFYTRLFKLIFVTAASRLRCPSLSIQGAYLMSINTSSTELARALVAWKSYSQDDYDCRPSLVIKCLTFLFFMIHLVVWLSLVIFYIPYFIHKMPSLTPDDPDGFYLVYAYLTILLYTAHEVTITPLWRTVRCLGWCRRSSGTTWRILALSDCYLLGHYSPLIMELHKIQMISNQNETLLRNKMVQKHWGLTDARKRKADSDSRIRRPPRLLAAVKAAVGLKKKLQRRKEQSIDHSGHLEDCLQGAVTPEDSSSAGGVSPEDEEIETLMSSNHDSPDTDTSTYGLEDELGTEQEALNKEEDKIKFEDDDEKSIGKECFKAVASSEGKAT